FATSTEYRAIDGTGNNLNYPTAGATGDKYLRVDLPTANFVDGNRQPLKTPTDGVLPGTAINSSCTDQLAADVYPLPRCVSNIVTRYGTNLIVNDSKVPIYKSLRKTSHMITFLGQYISYDTSAAVEYVNEPTYIYAPFDDANYNPPGSPPANIMAAGPDLGAYPNAGVLRQNRSQYDASNPALGGVNSVTGFLDLNPLYGPTLDQSNAIRDQASQRGKLLMANGYPPWNDTTKTFNLGGQFARSQNIFTLAINTVFLREHNRLCDWLYSINSTWTDEQYFQEARRWNIGQYQKIVSEEYLGIVTGRPLPPYTGYNPNEQPGTDVFFHAVAFRYGHSELSDTYNILNINGETLAELPFPDTIRLDLLPRVGLGPILRSMANQRNEEVDAYLSDWSRAWTGANKVKYEIAAFDVSRCRDLGIPLYNDARTGFGLARKNSFAEVTSNADIAARLQLVYGTVDKCEAFACAHAEDHVDGASVGELVYTALIRQFDRYRVTDRFWFQNYFSTTEQLTFRNRTFRDVIVDNLTPDELPEGITFPASIWTVLPPTDSSLSNAPNPITDPYPGDMTRWPEYQVRFGVTDKTLQFLINFATESGNGWFGIGFGPSDNGMTDADFIIGKVSSGSADLGNYISKGYQPPVLDSSHQDYQLTSTTLNGSVYQIEFNRPLAAASPGRKAIVEGQMKVIMAFNPTTNVVTYHGSRDRVRQLVDFSLGKVTNLQDTAIAASPERQRQTRLAHGFGMFTIFCIIFPTSIYVIRYYRHTTFYLKFHRNIQLFSVLLVATFGAAAIATIANLQTNHAKIGLAVYVGTFLQTSLGLTTYWSQQKIESVNEGLLRIVKRTHRYFGIVLMITAWFSLYLGIDLYCITYGADRVPWQAALIGVVALICLIFIGGQIWKIMDGKCRFKACTGAEAEEKAVGLFFDAASLNAMPDFTWDQVNEGVQRGAYLVVCDGFVADIRRWIHSHPGGEKILHRVIGTDITNDFYNTHRPTSTPKEEIDSDPKAADKHNKMAYSKGAHLVSPVLGRYTHLWERQALDPDQKLRRRKTISAKIDDFNIERFHRSSEPIARHKHTNFAVMQFAGMVIGKIKGDSYDERNVEKGDDAPPTPTTEQSYFRLQQPFFVTDLKKDTSVRVFKRYQLVEKALVNGDPERPVIKFTFVKLHQLKDPENDRIIPGDYIEIQARVKGQVIIRAYTPVVGRISRRFSIIVKVYEHGLMSQHLAHQRIGYELKVRGPFDLLDRRGVTHMTQNELSTIMGRRFSSTHSVISNLSAGSSTTGRSSGHLLLNPNSFDGCWDQLVMIAGGSGITPMVQLINFHLNVLASSRDRRVTMHLLFANKKVEDIIMGLELESLAANSKGALTVTYMLSNPPTVGHEWEGLHGHVTTSVLHTWLLHHGMNMYTVSSPRSPTAYDPAVQLDESYSPTLRADELSGNYDGKDSQKLANRDQYDMSDQPDLTNQEVVINNGTQEITSPSEDSTTSGSPNSMQPSHSYSKGTSFNYLMVQKKIVACGPPAMLDKIGASLKEMGYADDDYILLY
ncbi:9783_t:CDS:2, partial [Paraglomus occultum]